NNHIYNLATFATTVDAGAIGISLIGTGTSYVYNNMIAIGSLVNSRVLGFNQNTTHNIRLYNNSVNITGVQSNTVISSCYRRFTNTCTADVRNNIFYMD